MPNSIWGISLVCDKWVDYGEDCRNNIIRNNTVRNVLMEAWEPDTVYALGDIRRNGNKTYICVTPGTSASSGGPVGWTTSEADGIAEWDYRGTSAEILFTGQRLGMDNNRAYDNDTLQPVFHYSNYIPYDSNQWVLGEFYGSIEGTGSPEGVVWAGPGTMYQRTDSAELWLKVTGGIGTGWVKLGPS